ncbi:hypothetical protein [Streptosporangium carneum]|uniref:Uncharacterized protein n=1 Tax=Streptosporangium carneum TaxID=47481 RepID=A0A9W6IAU3_9ACTN|nr:hypothetical protein [Streptosporangium carneum]GLK15272.1 hypothetical protein GCM10017600_86850 [Streptosporangium carneum]
MAGSVSVALGASVCSSALASPSAGSLPVAQPTKPTATATVTVTPKPKPTVTVTATATATPSPTATLPTLAEEARRKCSPRNFFRFHHFTPRNFFIPRTRFIDGPGGTITASVRRQHRVYFELEIEREKGSEIDTPINRDTLIRRLRNNINPLLAEEHIVEAGHEYTQEVSEGKYGNLWYRVFGYRVGFSAWRQLGDCSTFRVGSGIANVPARVEGWRYWETDHPLFRGRKLSEK